MIQNILSFLRLDKLKDRSKIVAKNALMSLFVKGLSILLGFVFVPLYLGTVGQRKYGILITITSISSYISFFDVGIGKGLRIHLGRAIAEGNKKLGRQYVSTAYYYVTILLGCFFLIYCLASHWIRWYKILNIPLNEIPNLDTLLLMVVGFMALNFILQLLGTILLADQKSFMNDLFGFIGSIGVLIACFVLKWTGLLNFNILIITILAVPVIFQLLYSIILFSTQYKWLRPSLSFVKHAIRNDLLNLGFKYFLIQIVAIVIFSTTNILIAQLFNIGDVAVYNIGYKYYNITVMIFTILMSPLWGAFTHAWHQGDTTWIIKNIKFYLILAVALIFINIAQIIIYPYFIHIWLKRDVAIPSMLLVSFILYNFIFCYNDIFAHFLAGVGKVNKQLYAALLGGALNIPLTIYLAKYTQLGLSSILFANILCLLPSTFVTTIHTIQLVRAKTNERGL